MHSLQLLFRASHATLLLVLCLQLRTNTAQEDTTRRELIMMDFQMPRLVRAEEEVFVTVAVQTELRECMVIKTYLVSNIPMEGPFTYKYTACLCDDYPRTFFWDFQANSTMRVAAVVDVVRELGICPNDEAVVPIKANRFSMVRILTVA